MTVVIKVAPPLNFLKKVLIFKMSRVQWRAVAAIYIHRRNGGVFLRGGIVYLFEKKTVCLIIKCSSPWQKGNATDKL